MINSVYDYYLTTYAGKSISKGDAHKKSELRSVYNNIVKISKKSPLYKVNVSEGTQKYAIDLKENARSLSNDAKSLFSDSDLTSKKKKFISNDESIVTVNMLDDNSENVNDVLDKYNIEVKNLATPQVNTSNYLDNDSLSLSKGEHRFEINIGNNTYEFQFKANDNDNNKSVYEKLSRLINRSNIGLISKVLSSGNNSALQITSDSTGLTFNPEIFSINPSSENPNDNVVDVMGLDNVTSYPTNSNFLLNGMEKTSSTNTFTVNKSLEFTLKGISDEGQLTVISLNDDLDMALDSVNDLVTSYNKLIDLSSDNKDGNEDAAKLGKEISKTAKQYANELESVGITINDDNKLSFDDSLFIQASNEDSLGEALSKLDSFKKGIVSKADDISINPMKYVNKVMISYPNPVKSFANPYITSIYSGMMFNGYI